MSSKSPPKLAPTTGNRFAPSKPSTTVLKNIFEKLRFANHECEEAIWTIWGLVSSWNPDWRFNQNHMLSMAMEDSSYNISSLLLNVLQRNDDSFKQKALGTLVQLMYHNSEFKKFLSQQRRLLDLSVHLLKQEISMSLTRQNITLWTMRLLSTMCSTPTCNAEACEAIASHPALLDAIVDLARHNISAISAEVPRRVPPSILCTPRPRWQRKLHTASRGNSRARFCDAPSLSKFCIRSGSSRTRSPPARRLPSSRARPSCGRLVPKPPARPNRARACTTERPQPRDPRRLHVIAAFLASPTAAP